MSPQPVCYISNEELVAGAYLLPLPDVFAASNMDDVEALADERENPKCCWHFPKQRFQEDLERKVQSLSVLMEQLEASDTKKVKTRAAPRLKHLPEK